MTIALDDFLSLKRKVKSARKKRDEAKGAYDVILLRLKKEFDCSTIEEAKKLLAKMREKEAKLAATYQKKKKEFEEKWKEVLEEDDNGG